ncbi:MAG: hypothetical protein LBJ67_04950 [Planctomycetaceae bacterium]|nr:hypothetical protein [Planctomycetaceae bacterium]
MRTENSHGLRTSCVFSNRIGFSFQQADSFNGSKEIVIRPDAEKTIQL